LSNLIDAFILGIVEGLTEFLPISSTGHLIVASSLLRFTGEKVPTFEIAIQTGAMFAVIWEYRQRLLSAVAGIASEAMAQRFIINVAVAFIPAVVFGLLLGKVIKEHMFRPVPVAAAFVIGGFVILWAEARHRKFHGARDLLPPPSRARVETAGRHDIA
jgi:undecaprenyl-diphosphatase